MIDFVILLTILRETPEGISEHELMKHLALLDERFANVNFQDIEKLYGVHFLLFHSLYQLQNQLLENQQGMLKISATLIQLLPYAEGQQAIVEADETRHFYLDKNNFTCHNKDVEHWVKQFWESYLAIDQKADALRILELDKQPQINAQQVKQQYLKLSHEHHPDKGGDADRYCQIQQAYQVLRHCIP